MQDAKSKNKKVFFALCCAFLLVIGSIAAVVVIPKLTHAQTHVVAGGTGATLPYVEMEAHSAATNGTILGPDFQLGTLASDAVDRTAVQLTQGQYVEFTLPASANSINLRYSIPDAPGGGGINAPLSIYINGVKQTNNLHLTSKYSWVYGAPQFGNCQANDWSKTPGGTAHHQFDEVHTLLPQMSAGTKVRLQVDAEDTAPSYTIDVADFQQVAAPLTRPAGSISVTDAPYNADPTGAVDATTAIQNAVNDGTAQNKVVWIPQGNYLVTSHIVVDNVTLTGAGPWYAVLGGPPVNNGTGVGVFGKDTYDNSSSSHVHLANFAVEGQITNRVDCTPAFGIGGTLNHSTVSNIWVEHTKVGMWFDGPFDDLQVTNSRVDSTLADGINFHRAITNSSVSQTIIRGTGDDGLAMWPELSGGATIGDSNDTFDHNTVQSPYLANGIAIYGGNGNSVTNNVVTGAQYRGGGIMLDYEDFGNPSAPFSGTTTVANNTIDLTAGWGDQGIQQFGALMLWADSGSINAPITLSGNEIDRSNFAAISFDGGNAISTVTLNNININGAQFAFSNKVSTVTGSASNVVASNLTVGSLQSCESAGSWQIALGSGNSGWSPATQTCGFPTPTPLTPTPTGGTPTPIPPTPTPGMTPTPGTTPTPTPSPTPVPLGTLITAINAGGGATGNFVADTDFNQGNQFSDTSTTIDTSGVSNPAPQGVWQTVRWNSAFTYTIPGLTAGKTYTLRLDWAELSFQSAGRRVFNVAVNGNTVLSNFDVFAQVGYKKALVKSFTVTANSSGQIVIAFTQGGADNPFINGIEVWDPAGGPPPTPTPTPTPVPTGTLITAINAGGGATGNFVADTDFNQGNQFSDTSTAIDTSGVSNPAPQGVYQTCRWNSAFTYTIPGLTAGKAYTLQLDWAELSFHAAGLRVFNVAVNGSTVLSNFDVFAQVGYKKALAKSFNVTANSSGQIVVAFTQGGADNPFVNGLEIWGAAGDPAPTPTPTPTLVTAINAGGGAVGNFVADTGYNQGNQFSDTSSAITTSGVVNPAPQAVYQSCRWNSAFTYTLTGLQAGKAYTLQLDWAELSFHAAGLRVFNVAVNGNAVLSNFDVYANAGYKNALARQFAVTANGSGQIVISFSQGGADNPFINGIELYA